MIRSWKNAKTRRVFETARARGFPGLDARRAVEHLDMLEAAGGLDEISPLASVHLHKLKGDRKGQWAISVNGPWRICFRPGKDGFEDVAITDYH